MKKLHINQILLISLSILIISAFFINDPLGLFKKSLSNAPSLVKNLSISKLAYIQTSKDGETLLTFKKENDDWYVFNGDTLSDKDNVKIRSSLADADKVVPALNQLKEARRYQVISKRAENHSEYNLTSKNAFSLQLYDASKELIANLYIGKEGSTFSTTLVRLEDEDSVFLVKGRWLDDWDLAFDEFQDKTLLRFIPTNITSAEIINNKGSFTLNRNKDKITKWSISKNKDKANNPILADSNKVTDLLTSLSQLKGSSVYNEKVKASSKVSSVDLFLSSQITLHLDIFKVDVNKFVAQSSQFRDFVVVPTHLAKKLNEASITSLKKVESEVKKVSSPESKSK